jgi:hypothetical protein
VSINKKKKKEKKEKGELTTAGDGTWMLATDRGLI